MKSRMDRYNNSNSVDNTPSRVERNKDLYGDLYTNIKYTEVIDFDNSGPYVLRKEPVSNATREKYQRLKEYKNLINKEYKEEKFQPILKEETKIYDINVILEEAKKERKISNDSFQQFAEVSGIFQDGKSEEIKELINTITSSSLRKEIDKELNQNDLLSDLLPEEGSETTVLEPVETEVNLDNFVHEDLQVTKPEIDKTFYTKSMEFRTRDFERGNSNEYQEDEPKTSVFIKILTVISILLIVGALLFVIIKYIL